MLDLVNLWIDTLEIGHLIVKDEEVTMELINKHNKQCLYIVFFSEVCHKDIIPKFEYLTLNEGRAFPLMPIEVDRLRNMTSKILNYIKFITINHQGD